MTAPTTARDLAAMRRALPLPCPPETPAELRLAFPDLFGWPLWLVADFVAIALDGGRCEVRRMTDRFTHAFVHSRGLLLWHLPFDGFAELDRTTFNRFVSLRGVT